MALLAARVAAWASPFLLLDDSFISFRYAGNLVAGHGLVFNAGERVEGYTNFLWTVLLAASRWAGLDIPAMSVAFALLAALGTIVLLAALARELLGDAAPAWVVAAAALLFAANAAVTRFVLSGMETSLFVFLVTLGLYLALAVRDRPFAAGVVFALSAMTRPEGILYFGLVLLDACLAPPPPGSRRVAAAGAAVGGFLLLYAPYFAWRYAYYGYLLPNTFYVKVTGTGGLAARGLEHLRSLVRDASLEASLLLALGAVAAVWRDHRWRLLAAVVVASCLYFVLIGGDFLFYFGPRFLLPALPALLLLGGEALRGIVGPAGRSRGRTLLGAALLLALLGNAAWFSWPARCDRLRDVSLLNRSWTEVGKWLRRNSSADAVVAVAAAGRIPYYSGRRTVDILGLTDLHIAHLEMPLGGGIPGQEKSDPGYVLDRKPDYIVFARLDAHGRPLMNNWGGVRHQFDAHYEMVALVKASESPGPWIVPARAYTAAMDRRGYSGAIFRRKAENASPGEPAAGR